jgi:hypothetical protein
VADSTTKHRGWEQHEAEQLAARLRLTYRQRLDWLWQAKLFAEQARLAAQDRRRGEADERKPIPDGRTYK